MNFPTDLRFQLKKYIIHFHCRLRKFNSPFLQFFHWIYFNIISISKWDISALKHKATVSGSDWVLGHSFKNIELQYLHLTRNKESKLSFSTLRTSLPRWLWVCICYQDRAGWKIRAADVDIWLGPPAPPPIRQLPQNSQF